MQNKIFIKKLSFFIEPEKAFIYIFGKSDYAFWLDGNISYVGDASGPLSQIISYNVQEQKLAIKKINKTIIQQKNIFEYLDEQMKKYNTKDKILKLPFDFVGGFIGYFGYEMKKDCGYNAPFASDYPDAYFFFADRFLVFDQQNKLIYLVCYSHQENIAEVWFENTISKLKECKHITLKIYNHSQQSISFSYTKNHDQYINAIKKCQQLLFDGESYEICLTNEITANISTDYLTLYRILREINPAPYSAFLKFNDLAILSSSPEEFLRVDKNKTVTSKPIKGTIKREEIKQDDKKAKHFLETDKKTRAENLMIVDLLRNDLGKICEIGSITVPKLMHVESFATVHQLVSTIEGKLKKNISLTDAIKSTFPGGSMTGAPKKRTMEILDNIEGQARGIYSGILGYMSLNGTMDMSMIIRTIVATPNKLSIGVGGAITVESDPEKEYDEMLLKSKALIKSIKEI